MQAIVPYWTTKVAYILGMWHLGLNEKACSLLERKEHGCHRAFCWQLLPSGTCVVASTWDQEQMTLRRSCAAAARGQAAGQSPPRPQRVWELRCETRKMKRVRMRPGCTRGRREANVWYSGPANGILIDGWAEEIVGLQTAAVGLPACWGLRRQEIAGYKDDRKVVGVARPRRVNVASPLGKVHTYREENSPPSHQLVIWY
jgi:hypothetical protein